MNKRIVEVYKELKKLYPAAKCELNYSALHELCIGVILSAQCTDARVNQTTVKLFQKYKTLEDYAFCDIKDLETMIFSCGFYKNKAKNIKNFANEVINAYNGAIPGDLASLTKLSGVGRKTANVILSVWFNKPALTVDTHFGRLSRRLGFTQSHNPLIIEKDIAKILPKKYWSFFSIGLIYHGRRVCQARKPLCQSCALNHICDKNI